MGLWNVQSIVPGPVYYVEAEPGRLARLLDWVARELTLLRGLRPGWDGHRAKPISREALYSAVVVLAVILDENSEPPQFFPLPDGGIQFEWYADDQIEIEIDGAGEAHVLATATNGEVVAEGSFDPHGPSDLAATIAMLVKNFSAHVAAERQRTGPRGPNHLP